MTTKTRTNKGRFAQGNSGNSSGRPLGSRNKATLMMEALLEGEVEQLTRKAMELAMGGDTQALRLCLDRMMPTRKDRVVFFEFPPITGVDDIPQGLMSIMAAVSQGQLTPPEGDLLSRILVESAKAMTNRDVEYRLLKLEEEGPSPEGDVPIIQDEA